MTRYQGMAERVWAAQSEMANFEEELDELIGEFGKLGHDYYDASLEIREAANSIRLGYDAQTLIKQAGFGKVYVHHVDGWETHYSLHGDLPARGWRRRYVEDAGALTTNVIAGDPNPGYYEISHWPESWTGRHTADWLSTGYMRIVPDPLEADPKSSDLTPV